MRTDSLCDGDDLIGITSLGRYHINVLVKKFTYIDAMVIDTPIIDETVRSEMRDIQPINERLRRAELFLGYLNDCSNHLEDEAAKGVWENISSDIAADVSGIHTRI